MGVLKLCVFIIGYLVLNNSPVSGSGAPTSLATVDGSEFFHIPTSGNYPTQAAECEGMGWRLAVVDTDAKQTAIAGALTGLGVSSSFIALRFDVSDSSYNWQTEDEQISLASTDTQWAIGSNQPVDGVGSCVVMSNFSSFEWETADCGNTSPAVCERLPEPQDECADVTTIVAHPSNFSLSSFEGYEVVIANEQLLSYQLNSDSDFCYPENFDSDTAVFTFNITDCFPVVQEMGDYLTYTYTVWAIEIENATHQILRYSDNCFNTTCIYPNEKNVTSDYVMPSIRKFTFDGETAQGEFTLEFELFAFANCSYTESFSGMPPTVQVSDYVYARITDDVTSPSFILQAQSCWASPYEYPYNNVTYPIIENRCPADNSFDPENAIEVIKNFNETILFKFKSFVWTNFTDEDQKIYVHCTVTFCDTLTDLDCTTNNCPSGRKRRDLGQMESHVVSVGPMSIDTDLCQKNNGGCEEICAMVNHEKMCSCFGAKMLGEDQHSCIDFEAVNGSFGQMWLIEEASWFIWLTFAVLFVLTLILYIQKKREN